MIGDKEIIAYYYGGLFIKTIINMISVNEGLKKSEAKSKVEKALYNDYMKNVLRK